jgi:flagellar motor switch protein FliM
MLLDDDEIEALSIAATGGKAVAGQPRTVPLQLGRSDQELSRAAAFLDIHVSNILRRLREAVRHQTRRQIDIDESAPRLIPVQDLLVSETGSPMVVVEIGAGVGLPPGLMVMNDSSARALALMAIAPSSSSAGNDIMRPLSPAERRLLARFLSSLLTSFAYGLPREVPLHPLRLVRVYADPRELLGIDRSANMIGLPIAFTGDLKARIEVAMPSSWLVTARGAPARPRNQRATGRRLGDHPGQVMVQVAAELGHAHMTLRKLLSLAPGDLVLLGSSPKALVPVLIQGRPRLHARAEVREGRVAMVVASPAKEAKRTGTVGSTDIDVDPRERSLVATMTTAPATARTSGDAHHG